MKYTANFSEKTNNLKRLLNDCETIVIGAGAGLSTAAGFDYSGARFDKYFGDFKRKYGFTDMYSGGFYPFETSEEYWAYWSRYVFINRYCDPPEKEVYAELNKLVENKDYFVITTNVDHCFVKAVFDKNRLFYTQGDYGLFQCSVPCKNKTYDNEQAIKAMVVEQKDMKIPKSLLPVCPECGKPMTINLRADDKFVEDEGWHAACRRYEEFMRKCERKNVLYLELGVGMNTPGIIKFPFMRAVAENKRAHYVCVNYGEAFAPDPIESRSICINADIANVLAALSGN